MSMIEQPFTHVVMITGSRHWSNRDLMKNTFNELWKQLGVTSVDRPVLISGGARGADQMAEQLWRDASLEVIVRHADWERHGRRAGFVRNADMVATAQVFADAGAVVRCIAFLQECDHLACSQAHQTITVTGHQAQHYSHGTSHARSVALQAGLTVLDVVDDAALVS